MFMMLVATGTSLLGREQCPATAKQCFCYVFHKMPVINCNGLGRISVLPNFRHHRNTLQWLQFLNGTSISTLPNRSFTRLKIKELWMTNMGITTIEPEAFVGLENHLEEINLSFNYLRSIPTRSLRILPLLSFLKLTSNEITRVTHSDLVPFVDSLVRLDLGNNAIRFIGKAFASLRSLKKLALYGNPITTIDGNAFQRLAHTLSDLQLAGCQLTSLPVVALSKLHALETLDMTGNNITRIQSYAFCNLRRIKEIRLDSNQIGIIEPNAFCNLPSLRHLLISGNHIRSNITKSMFIGLSAVSRIDLSDNQIRSMENLFEAIPTLTFLDVDQNSFHCDCSIEWMRESLLRYYSSFRMERCSSPAEESRYGYSIIDFPRRECSVSVLTTEASSTLGLTVTNSAIVPCPISAAFGIMSAILLVEFL